MTYARTKKSAVDRMPKAGIWYYRVSTVVKFLPGKNIGHIPLYLEAEKYQGALYRGNKKKKADPQKKWMNSVSKAAATAKGSSAVIDIFAVSEQPRKRPAERKKFMNYLKFISPGWFSKELQSVDIIHKIHVDGDTSVNQNQNNEKKRSADTANVDANATKKQK